MDGLTIYFGIPNSRIGSLGVSLYKFGRIWINRMNSQYKKLIELAEELDTPSNPKKVTELNELLAGTSAADVKPEHFSMLDSIISIMSNTGNLFATHEVSILELLEGIRSRAAA